MKWIIMSMIVACLVIKLILHKKLRDIDGFGGILDKHDTGKNEYIVIGKFGR